MLTQTTLLALILLIVGGCGTTSATLPVDAAVAHEAIKRLYADPRDADPRAQPALLSQPAFATDTGLRFPGIEHRAPNATGQYVSTIKITGKIAGSDTTITTTPLTPDSCRVEIDTIAWDTFPLSPFREYRDRRYQQDRLSEIRRAIAAGDSVE